MPPYTLSIIIPVYNERLSIITLLEKLAAVPFATPPQIIIVDDGSTDGTREVLQALPASDYTVLLQPTNGGKGSAIRAGLTRVTGTHVVIQDADLEYDPQDLLLMINHMVTQELAVLYGSRSLLVGKNKHAGFSFYWGGQLLTFVTNILYRQTLTDEPTCYKMFRAPLLLSLPLVCERFEFCPEVTAKVARLGYHITEVPIRYYPRDAAHGKKIKWRDGVEALYVLFKNRL